MRSHNSPTSACQDKNGAMKSEQLPVEPRGESLTRHRSEQGYKTISKALSVPSSTVTSIIVKVCEELSGKNRGKVLTWTQKPGFTFTELQKSSAVMEDP